MSVWFMPPAGVADDLQVLVCKI